MQIKIMTNYRWSTLFWTTFLLLLTSSSIAKKLNASEAFDEKWQQESDLENELEQKRSKGSSWSGWSDWSTCSRSCDGGVSQQLRRCHNKNGCKGENIRFRICNMQPCPEQQDFRAHQCQAYDDVPYDGTLYRWTPHYDYLEPCALTCRGRPAHLPDDGLLIESETEDGGEHFEEPSVIVQLSGRVMDGTRCRSGSLDMCIQGKCQRVGCDLKIGSSKKVDACGICGGDGSSCTQPLYQWETSPMSLCSVTCGGGYKMTRPICKNSANGAEVEESLCSASTRPEPTVVECNTHSCPPMWITDEWGPCNQLCGNGYRHRSVVCIEDNHGVKTRLPDPLCRGTPKPTTKESCFVKECPKWVSENWSDKHDKEDVESDVDDEQTESSVYNDQPAHYSHQQMHKLHHEESAPRAERLTGDRPPQFSTEPTFYKDSDWSPCSVTCGEGIRRKSYRCKIFLEYSRTIATVNDTLCEGQKPQDEVERCVEDPCMLPSHGYDEQYPRDSIKVGVSEPGKTYVWQEQGYTSCSASCLGGVEELIINCVREDNGRVVSPFLCSPETKPEARVRTCNDRPCPPRWNYSDYSPCSKSCGIGIKTREVQCIHEVTRGGENTMVVPNSMCPQPPPADRQYCNVLDCPVRWEVGEWSKCSHTCGYGIKERKVECKQIMAQEHKIDRVESLCPSQKPADKKPCNVKPCPPEDPKPIISVSNTTHIQHDPKKTKITLKVGGAAVVFFGTQVKIKCPVKRYNRTKIRWTKDHRPLARTRKFKVSRKAALRILDITFRDAGVYSCHAGLSTAEINIDVKAKPGMQPEDYEKDDAGRFERQPLTSADMTAVDGGSTSSSASSSLSSSSNNRKGKNGRERSRHLKADGETDSTSVGDEFFWPFQNFQNSRGQHMLFEKSLKYGVDTEFLERDEPADIALNTHSSESSDVNNSSSHPHRHHHQTISSETLEFEKHQNATLSNTSTEYEDEAADEQHEQPEDVKSNSNRKDVTYEWMTTEWTQCSQKCGGSGGLRSRSAFCIIKSNDTEPTSDKPHDVVDNSFCEDSDGLEIPDTFEACGNEECPKWSFGEWTNCQHSRCFGRYTAIQKREVTCKFSNYTITDKCDENEKPIERQECYNELCKSMWRVEPWSECNAACGKQGIKYRILQCVWYGTTRPAGNACRYQTRPSVMKICKGPPCIVNSKHCKDISRYCKNARTMGLCRLQRYQKMCCRSCRWHH
ncbi:ADAMTSL1 family protein [Megaselia abdita]